MPTSSPSARPSKTKTSDFSVTVDFDINGKSYVGEYNSQLADRALSNFVFKRRTYQLAKSLLAFFALTLTDKMSAQEDKQGKAKRVCKLLTELGPSFVKLGQFISCRKDLLPEALKAEFALLEDRIEPMPYETIEKIVEADFGMPPTKLFKKFERKPIAAASIGQVHRALLSDGRIVAVKVQRPHLPAIFYRDIGYIRLLARLWGKFAQKSKCDFWIELADEFGQNVFAEIDYLNEGRNADRLRHDFRLETEIQIPRIFWKYTSRRVLTLEYLPGIKISNTDKIEKAGIDAGLVAGNLVKFYARQILSTGFFHADPHAGNLAVGEGGELIVYDFGMTGYLKEADKASLKSCLHALVTKDSNALCLALKRLGIVTSELDENVKIILDSVLSYLSGGNLTDIDWQHIENHIDELIKGQYFRLPPSLTYLIKTVSSLEGIVRNLKPTFNYQRALRPTLQAWLADLLLV